MTESDLNRHKDHCRGGRPCPPEPGSSNEPAGAQGRAPLQSDEGTPSRPTVLVAGMGSELRTDDAFGIFVVRRLLEIGPPGGVEVFEAGTAGIGLVQQLFDGYEHLIVVDATDRDREPGSVYLLQPEIEPMTDYRREDQHALLSDMHYTVPNRVLTLAQALGVLPESVYIVGCQPGDLDLGLELSPPVAAAVDEAVQMIRDLTDRLIAADKPPRYQNPQHVLPSPSIGRGAGGEGD